MVEDMSSLVLVEGESDEGFIKGLAERLSLRIKILKMRGNRPNKAVRLIKAVLESQSFSKAIILKDQHSYPEELIQEKLLQIREEISKTIKTDRKVFVHGIIVKKAIEAWILAGLGVNNPENIDDPDKYLDEILRRRRRGIYIKSCEKAKHLAMEIDLYQAMKHSNQLKEFIDFLHDP